MASLFADADRVIISLPPMLVSWRCKSIRL